MVIFFVCCFHNTSVEAAVRSKGSSENVAKAVNNSDPYSQYLLPSDHPLQEQLKGLFKTPRMFDSVKDFMNQGFKIIRGHRDLMVGLHPNINGYLIKKFPNFRSQQDQLNNFVKRIKAARIIEKYIKDHQFKHLIVPKKWLYELPGNFSSKMYPKQYVLIVEKMEVIPGGDHGESRRRYFNMDKDVLKEYCTLLYDLDGCDAWPRNQPFTKSGQIAFLDTEHLGMKKGDFITHIIPFLNKENKKYALELWKRLEQSDRGMQKRPMDSQKTSSLSTSPCEDKSTCEVEEGLSLQDMFSEELVFIPSS